MNEIRTNVYGAARIFRHVIFLLVLLASTAPLSAQEQYWEHQRIAATDLFQFFEVQCADSMHCVAVGARRTGYIFRTTDGGKTWPVVWSTPDLKLYDIAHPAPNLIVMVADSVRNGRERGVIVRSTDGGATWSYTALPTDSAGLDIAITGIDMSDALNGIIAQRISNRILRTRDGGLSWQEIALPDTTVRYTSNLSNPDSSTYIVHSWSPALGRFVIHRTTDAGGTWQSSSEELPPLVRMRFLNRTLGYGAGEGAERIDVISRTTDGGLTWNRLVERGIDPVQGLTDIACLDSLDCIAVGNTGKIVRTRDGWASWTTEESGFGASWYIAHMNAVAYPARTTAIVAALNGYLLRYRPEGLVGQPRILLPVYPTDQTVSTSPRIVWSAVEGATAYQVQISLSPGYDPLAFDRTVTGDTSVVATGLDPFKEYNLRVRAIGATGPGNWSNPPHGFRTGGASSVAMESLRMNGGLSVSPNPFMGSTRVRLQVGAGATLGLYTMLGEQVAVPGPDLSGYAGRDHTFEINTSQLAAGTYLLRYRDAERVEVLILVHSPGPGR